MPNPCVLVVDDEEIACQNLVHVLKRENLDVDSTTDSEKALQILENKTYQLVLTDLRMPGIDGLSLLKLVKERSPNTEVIVITAHASTASAVDAMRAGAFYYIEKPFRLHDVRKVVKEALEKTCLKAENAKLKAALSLASGKNSVVTNSALMEELLLTATRIAPTDCSVLIYGETGAGKEVIARHVHDHSHRAQGPFIAINCGALPEDLLANELFGHERGAFTGASAMKSGLLEMAEGGTLFLDEVTEMAPSVQVKLLRFLQEKEFYRLGGLTTIKANIRVIAATNRIPTDCVTEGRLRQDLYFRLNVIGLNIPPLRARRGDIPILAMHFLSRAAQRMNKQVSEIHADAFECLLAHDYPGNVRELENLMERGVALAVGNTITAEFLPADLWRTHRRIAGTDLTMPIVTLAELERQHINQALAYTQGNRTAAAQLLGIDRASLWRKLRHQDGAIRKKPK